MSSRYPKSSLYKGLDTLFYGLKEGSEAVGLEPLAQYFEHLGDYTKDNLAFSLKYDLPKDAFDQKVEDVEREYQKDLRNNTFVFGPMERNPDGSIKRYGGAGSLGPRSLKSIKEEELRKGITKRATDILPIMVKNMNISPLERTLRQQYAPMLPLTPIDVSDNSWLPYGYNRDAVIGVEKILKPHENLNFVSQQNENPNAAFATTGFKKISTKTSEPKKIYRVVI